MATSNRLRNQGSGFVAYLFFIALVTGIAAIVLLKVLGAHQLVVTVVPVGIMLVYACIIYSIRKFRLRLDQAGDNLYYLGFLYTLTSLAYSLFEFGSNGTDTSSIITNFGIAICTTITGLALRVLFSQFRTDPIETESLARMELADASRHLKNELGVAARDIAMFHRSLEQMTTEAFQGLHETLNETMLGSLTRFEGSIELFASTVTEVNRGLENRSEALRESSDKLVSNISDLALRIDRVKVSDDILVRKLQPAIDKISEALRESSDKLVSNISDLALRIDRVKVSDDILVRKLQPAIDKISEALRESSDKLVSNISDLALRIDEVKVSDDILVRKLQPAVDKIDGSAQQLGYSMDTLSKDISSVSIPEDMFINQLQPAIDKVYEALRESSDKLVSNISDLALRIDGVKVSDDILVRKLQPVVDKIDGSAQQLGYSMDTLSKDISSVSIPEDMFINQLQPAIDKISEALRESSDKLVSSISDLALRIDEVKVSDDILVRKLQPAVSKISEATEMADEHTSSSSGHMIKLKSIAGPFHNNSLKNRSRLAGIKEVFEPKVRKHEFGENRFHDIFSLAERV